MSDQLTSPARLEILLIVNRPGWAQDFKARQLERLLGDQFRFTHRWQTEATEADLDRADLIVVFFWRQFKAMPTLDGAFWRNRRKLVLGVCSHFDAEAPAQAAGKAIIRRLARAVFVNSRLLEAEVRPLFDGPLFYTPNGVDTELFKPAPSPRPTPALQVGWAGSLGNHGAALRGYHDLIVPAVQRTAGADLRAAVREEKWRTHAEMVDYYNSLDVYVCASRHEGTPNPCLEAAACGVPVVTTRVGNMPELIVDGQNGLFVERDVADIAAKLARLRDDAALRERLGRNLRASVEAWDWKIQAENYRRMFETLLCES